MTVTRDWSTNGIDVVSDGGASGDGLSFMEIDGVLAARTVGRTDVTPTTARALADALNRWADERDPQPAAAMEVQWGVLMPRLTGIRNVRRTVDEEQARKWSSLPYVVNNKHIKDAEPVGRIITAAGPWINLDALTATMTN